MAKPFVRVAGGKRQLLPQITELLPKEFNSYYEPFVGGGALFFALDADSRLSNDHTTVLNDFDGDLADLWRAVRDDPKTLYNTALKIASGMTVWPVGPEQEQYYLAMRTMWNLGGENRTPALNLFLRSTSFNGLWRVNSKGHMNVPWRKTEPRLPTLDALYACQDALHQVFITSKSYNTMPVMTPQAGDFVFCDPPYLGGFVSYVADGWDFTAAEKFVQWCNAQAHLGVHMMVTHSDTLEFRSLITQWWPEANIHQVEARRNINSDGTKRGPVGELIVTSY